MSTKTIRQRQTTHTPGPWFTEGEYIHAGIQSGAHALDRKPTQHIATVHVTDRTRATLDANARLIAAAPALLAALQLALRYLESPEVVALPFALNSEAAAERARKAIESASA